MLRIADRPVFGTDPEAFFKRDGRIIGSEKLIPENGVRCYSGVIVRDGVQFELNPVSAPTIEELGTNISGLFTVLTKRLAQHPDVSVCFDGLVEVDKEELNALDPKSRLLGCMPSYNIYGEKPITVDPVEYRKRSSGGHIHFGISDDAVMGDRRRMVPLCDVIIGNTAVLLDRDPGAAERRENYGRAGEFRLPDHGLEYRTTSNFWLRDYSLMSFTFGLAHIAYAIAVQAFNGNAEVWADITRRADIKSIVKAIDTNDRTLALRNLKKLVPFLRKYLPKDGFVLSPLNIDNFIDFAQIIETKGVQNLFPEDRVVSGWATGNRAEFQQFIT